MKFAFVLIALAFAGAVFAFDGEVENGVYVLTPDNFDDFINNEDFTLVEFYVRPISPYSAFMALFLCGLLARSLSPLSSWFKFAGVLTRPGPVVRPLQEAGPRVRGSCRCPRRQARQGRRL